MTAYEATFFEFGAFGRISLRCRNGRLKAFTRLLDDCLLPKPIVGLVEQNPKRATKSLQYRGIDVMY